MLSALEQRSDSASTLADTRVDWTLDFMYVQLLLVPKHHLMLPVKVDVCLSNSNEEMIPDYTQMSLTLHLRLKSPGKGNIHN